MKISATVVLSLIAFQPVMAGTIEEMLSQLKPGEQTARTERFGRPQTNVGYEFVDHDFVIPVAGNAEGAYGTHWKSEVVISNYLNRRQRISVSVLEMGKNSGTAQPIILELPAFEDKGDLGIVTEDFMGYLGKSGLAAIVVQAVDSTGKPDTTAVIDGYSRIWTLQPTSANCPTPDRGTVSQGMMTVSTESMTGHDYPAFAVGLRQDETYRTNVGIVNLSPKQVSWIVNVVGTRGAVSTKITVPGNSMIQQPIDGPSRLPGIYGTMSISFEVDETSLASTPGDIASQHTGDTALLWNAYASSVDNRSGDGWTRQASY